MSAVAHETEQKRVVPVLLERINQRLGWVLATYRLAQEQERDAMRQLMTRIEAIIAPSRVQLGRLWRSQRLQARIEPSQVQLERPSMPMSEWAVPQSNIVPTVGGFDTIEAEVRYTNELACCLFEMHRLVAEVKVEPLMQQDPTLCADLLTWIAAHNKAAKYYLQSL